MTDLHPSPCWAGGSAVLLWMSASLCACRTSSELPRSMPSERADVRVPAAPIDAAPSGSTLADYLRFGLSNSARLRAAFEESYAEAERAGDVGTLPFPRLTYGEFAEEVQTRTGPQERRVGLTQAFPWPGELDARASAARSSAQARRDGALALRQEVARDIEIAFHEYAFLGREEQIRAELLEVLRGLEPVVRSRVRSGAPQEELLRLQVEVGRLEDDLASVARRRPALSARLADSMTWRTAPRLLEFPVLEVPELRAVDVDVVQNQALETNPVLRESGSKVQAASEAQQAADFISKPSFSFGVDWIDTAAALDPTTPGSGDDPVLLRIGVELPLWRARTEAVKQGARHELRAARERLVSAESKLRANVEHAAYLIDDGSRRVALYRDSLLPRAAEALQLTLSSYRTGAAGLIDVIDSERVLLEFRLALWRACRDVLIADAEMSALVGEMRGEQ